MADLIETAHAIAATGKVEPADIRALRMAIFADGVVTRTEAEALFAIERTRSTHNDAWSELFVEALTDYALRQELPVEYLTDDTANWIMGQIKQRREPSMDADMALVAELIEKAREVPPAFSAFALRLAKDAVIYGDGPDERGRMHAHGRVTDADVVMLKRVLWGAGSEGQLAISRDEAEALCAIADATNGADNVPEFEDLFARAVGNYLIGATGRAVPTRKEALEWTKRGDYHASVLGALGALGKMMRPSVADLAEGAHMRSLTEEVSLATEAEHKSRNDARAAAMAAAEIMTPEKAGWLLDHIGKNGVVSGPEKALVRFIQREASALDPSLRDAFAKVA